jgi:uncharacterized protein YijF (DUF1287 family)
MIRPYVQYLLIVIAGFFISRVQISTQHLAEASRRRLPDDHSFATNLAKAALDRTHHSVSYRGGYLPLDYPNGDVPADIGVCTDEIIRTLRLLGVDLQKLVHEDMMASFSTYPQKWGASSPDRNIDHRRVPNLETFFKRQGMTLPSSADPADYLPADIVTYASGRHFTHIAIIVPAPDGSRVPWIIHNSGQGPQCENRLFDYPITGHFRFQPSNIQRVFPAKTSLKPLPLQTDHDSVQPD